MDEQLQIDDAPADLQLADELADKAMAYIKSGLYEDRQETEHDLANEILAFKEFKVALARYRLVRLIHATLHPS